jgi:hypothetical protein
MARRKEKEEEKKEEKPKRRKPEAIDEQTIRNLPSGKFSPLYTDTVYVVRRDPETGKKQEAYLLEDILEYMGL